MTFSDLYAAIAAHIKLALIKMPAVTFRNSEDDYFEWLKSHPDGFVVNTRAKESPDYMVLHRATCTMVNEYLGMAKTGAFTERQFKKTCSESPSELQQWAAERGGSLWLCRSCKPEADDVLLIARVLQDKAAAATDDDEARRKRLAVAARVPNKTFVLSPVFVRNPDVIAEVLVRAKGVCERCGKPAPFKRRDGRPYLEVHHLRLLSMGGEDTIENAQAQCPNCHRECHFGAQADDA